jgi:hypothetical protein
MSVQVKPFKDDIRSKMMSDFFSGHFDFQVMNLNLLTLTLIFKSFGKTYRNWKRRKST